MKQMTVRINEEECVIMPAPKGAFIWSEDSRFLYYPTYIALRNNKEYNRVLDIIPLYPSDSGASYLMESSSDNEHLHEVLYGYMLSSILKEYLFDFDEDEISEESIDKEKIKNMYLAAISHGTQMDYTAIEWFKEKFKEYNITKADFDVFA